MEDTVQELLAAGKTSQAFKIMLVCLKKRDPDLYDQAIMLSGRYETLKAQRRAGIISLESFEKEENDIRQLLQSIARESGCATFRGTFFNNTKLWVLSMFLIFLAFSTYYTFNHFFTNPTTDHQDMKPINPLPSTDSTNMDQSISLPVPDSAPGKPDAEKKENKGLFLVTNQPVTNQNSFPKVQFTLSNNTGTHQVVEKITIEIIEFAPFMGSPTEASVLEPLTTWDIALPLENGKFDYYPPRPISIPNDQAGSLSLRFFVNREGKYIYPDQVGRYRLRVKFITNKKRNGISPEIML